MSVAQFSPVLRQRLIEIYGDSSNKIDLAGFKKTRKQIFKELPGTKDLRRKFESQSFHSSSLTLEGLSALSQKIIETVSEENIKTVVENFLNNPNFFYNFVTYVESKVPQGGLEEISTTDYRLPNIPQDNLKNYFVEYIRSNLAGVPKTVIDNIRDNIQSGHLAGIFTLKLKAALGISTKFSTEADATYRDFTVSMPGLEDEKALNALDAVLKALLDADYLTSNLISESQVFVDATKQVLGNDPQLITELQFKEDNEAAGKLLTKSGEYLNKLIQSVSKGEMGSTESAIKNLIQSLQPVVDIVLKRAEDLKVELNSQGLYDKIVKNAEYLSNTLINTPGSVTLKDGIGLSIAHILKTGKTLKEVKTKIKPKPIRTKHKEVVDISKVTRDFKTAVQKIKQAVKKSKISKTVKVKRTQQPSINIANLQSLLNAGLYEQIRKNMGTGSRRDVLNFRSGRFAESATVERLSESRQGMITAFYSYMKYPYATFSKGGLQSSPTSRDPKLLISKSIRELAAPMVTNRLRAVNV